MTADFFTKAKSNILPHILSLNPLRVLTNSFQFPFEVDMNMCNIVQSGESFDLRINNMAFSQLSGAGILKINLSLF